MMPQQIGNQKIRPNLMLKRPGEGIPVPNATLFVKMRMREVQLMLKMLKMIEMKKIAKAVNLLEAAEVVIKKMKISILHLIVRVLTYLQTSNNRSNSR